MSRSKFHGLTYEGLAAGWGLLVCDSHVGCKRRWPEYRHTVGAVDQYGYLHWSPIHSRMTKSGLRNFLKLIAWNRLTSTPAGANDWKRRPLWWRIYKLNVEAYRIARNELHINLNAEDSFADRARVRYLARYTSLRTQYPAVYDWTYWPWKKHDEQRRRDVLADTSAA